MGQAGAQTDSEAGNWSTHHTWRPVAGAIDGEAHQVPAVHHKWRPVARAIDGEAHQVPAVVVKVANVAGPGRDRMKA